MWASLDTRTAPFQFHRPHHTNQLLSRSRLAGEIADLGLAVGWPRRRGRDRHPHGPRRRLFRLSRRLGRAANGKRDRARPPEDSRSEGRARPQRHSGHRSKRRQTTPKHCLCIWRHGRQMFILLLQIAHLTSSRGDLLSCNARPDSVGAADNRSNGQCSEIAAVETVDMIGKQEHLTELHVFCSRASWAAADRKHRPSVPCLPVCREQKYAHCDDRRCRRRVRPQA